MPATQNRVAPSAAGAPAEIELTGPVAIHYADPASDPRKPSRDLVTELGLSEMIRAISYPQ